MSFGGYNPGGSSELPFSNPSSAGMRSRASSISSVHSNNGGNSHYQQQQQQQQSSPYQSPYGSRPGTPLVGSNEGYFGAGGASATGAGGYGSVGYDGYESGCSSPGAGSSYMPTPPVPNQHRQNRSGSTSSYRKKTAGAGYDSPSAGVSSSTFYGHHSRTQSNASEMSLNIDTGVGDGDDDGPYSPQLASLSSASSSRRGSFSDAGSPGGFFSRKIGKTFRPESHQSPEDYMTDDVDSGDDRKKADAKKNGNAKGAKVAKRGRVGVKDIFNDWDLLLPSTDPYADGEDDDDELNDDEKWKKKQLSKKGWESPRGQFILISFLVIIATFVRIWKLAIPSAVVFDEQHFGGFAGDYLKGEFFMDTHPPLGKMLYAGVAYLLGFDGDFDFMPGKLYTKNVPYIGMRLFAVACGVSMIPVSYFTIKKSGHSTQAAMICAVLITFENAMVTQSRFILLDAPMMLFMGYTMLSWINFYNYRNRPFTRGWWFWLLQTGFSLFLSSSVKWVGLFTIATVGVCVLKYLQESRTTLYISTRDFSKQFIALFICLLVLPGVLYVGLYALDFRLLSKSGSGNAWVSPQFQMTLKGHDVLPVMADIAWDSKVHIRHANTNGGWIHTMPGEYTRDGSKDQAVQLVEWDDDLTCWQIYPADPLLRQKHVQNKQERKEDPSVEFDGYVYDGDNIRLRHCYSKVALATNEIESVGSNKTFLKEIRGIRWTKQPAEETVWRVELIAEGLVPGLADYYGPVNKDGTGPVGKSKDGSSDDAQTVKDPVKQWHSIKGFRLWNEKQQCYLQSHKAFRSAYSTYQEVACVQGARQKSNTIFIIDQNVNPHLPKSTPSLSYQPLTFFQKFLELNRVMWWTHHDLSAPVSGDDHSGDKYRNLDKSRPWDWPLMRRGMNYYSSKETNNYVHFMGNPLLWWTASAAVGLYMMSCLWSVFKFLKGKHETTKTERDRFGITPFYSVASGTFFAGWLIHYIPFFFMSRQVFLHHYLPALYFSILLLVSRLDRTLQRMPPRIKSLAGIGFMAAIILSWYSFAPFAYGTNFGSKAQCEQLRSIGGWKFTCDRQELAWARPNSSPAAAAVRAIAAEEEDNDNESHFYDWEDEESPQQQQQQQQQPLQQQQQHATPRDAETDEHNRKVAAAAEAKGKEALEKQRLMAEKEELERKRRELEERLAAQEKEIERQRAEQARKQQQQQNKGQSREELEEQVRILEAQLRQQKQAPPPPRQQAVN
ncbi:hypothetical protein BGZ46_002710 [Entomortierella lignicola]|nr:hypothetical protein BGZ46_002710 [Entomortierella lignicola]